MTSPHRPTPASDQLLRYGAWTRRLARSLVGNDDLAEDIAQEAWISTWRRPPDATAPLGPWFRKIIRHRLFNRARDGKRRQAREREATTPEGISSPEELVGRVEMQKLLVEVVLGLAEPYRQTLLLRYFEELSSAEVAERMKVPASTVRGRLKTALALVREGLDARSQRRTDWMDGLADLLDARPATPGQGPRAPDEARGFDRAPRANSSGTKPRPAAGATGLAAKALVGAVLLAAALPASRWIAKRQGSSPPSALDQPGEQEKVTAVAPRDDQAAPSSSEERGVGRNAGRRAEAKVNGGDQPTAVAASFTGIVGTVRVADRPRPGFAPPSQFNASGDNRLIGVLIKIVKGVSPTLAAGGVPSGPVSLRLLPQGIWPRFQIARIGQAILVENGDASPRQVKVVQGDAVLFEGSLPARSGPLPVTTAREGDVIRIEQGREQGKAAFVGTTDNPFHAVVDAGGHFSLGSLPPGTYTVDAWHERLGTSRVEATVPAGGVARIGIVLEENSPTGGPGVATNSCQIATRQESAVGQACQEGGLRAAKKLMKTLVATARNQGRKFHCEDCHDDLGHYVLREGANAQLAELLTFLGDPSPAVRAGLTKQGRPEH